MKPQPAIVLSGEIMSFPCVLFITSTTILQKRNYYAIVLEWEDIARIFFTDCNVMSSFEIGLLEQKLHDKANLYCNKQQARWAELTVGLL